MSGAVRYPGVLLDIPGGTFRMGANDPDGWPADGEGPVRPVTVAPFRIGQTAVTVAEFGEFVRATGYVTEAEKFGFSFVFHLHLPESKRRKLRARTVQGLEWWVAVEGACWKRPEGPGTNALKRQDHPATHLSWADAAAYCAWAGGFLPTEAQWERAARGGVDGQRFPWGAELAPGGKHRCNTFQGVFPARDTGEDGHVGTAPAKAFAPNAYGLHNVCGNVWEWCRDWFSPSWHLLGPREDPEGPAHGQNRAMRGGSFLCHASYCNRYRLGARTGNTPDSSAGNIGFRFAAKAAG